VEAACDLVEARPVRCVNPGASIAFVPAKPDFTGQEQLPAAEQLLAAEDPFSVMLVISAPGRVDGPDITVAESESGRTCVQDVRTVGTRAAFPVLAQVGAGPQRAALRNPFVVVAAREVEQLRGLCREREGQGEILDGVPLRGQVGQRRPAPQQAARKELQRQVQAQSFGVVEGAEFEDTGTGRGEPCDRCAIEGHGGVAELGRPSDASEGAPQPWPARPSAVLPGQQGRPGRQVQGTGTGHRDTGP